MNKNAEYHDIYAQKDTQTIAQKSKILKSAFAVHSRHVSEGFIQEILYSKPDPKDFNTFIEMIDELEFELVELENNEQTTMGQQTISIKFSADYVVNSRLNLKMFYDKIITNPFITTTYPGAITNAGFSLRFTLAG